MFAALGSWWPPKWVQADWVLRAAWWIFGDTVTAGTRCDAFHDPGTALLPLYRAPVVGNTLLNIVTRSGCFATPVLEKTLNSSPPTPPPPGGYPTNFKRGGFAQPLTILYTIFDRKCIPFRRMPLDKWYPSHVLSLNASVSRLRFFRKPQWQISPTFHIYFDDKWLWWNRLWCQIPRWSSSNKGVSQIRKMTTVLLSLDPPNVAVTILIVTSPGDRPSSFVTSAWIYK